MSGTYQAHGLPRAPVPVSHPGRVVQRQAGHSHSPLHTSNANPKYQTCLFNIIINKQIQIYQTNVSNMCKTSSILFNATGFCVRQLTATWRPPPQTTGLESLIEDVSEDAVICFDLGATRAAPAPRSFGFQRFLKCLAQTCPAEI